MKAHALNYKNVYRNACIQFCPGSLFITPKMLILARITELNFVGPLVGPSIDLMVRSVGVGNVFAFFATSEQI